MWRGKSKNFVNELKFFIKFASWNFIKEFFFW